MSTLSKVRPGPLLILLLPTIGLLGVLGTFAYQAWWMDGPDFADVPIYDYSPSGQIDPLELRALEVHLESIRELARWALAVLGVCAFFASVYVKGEQKRHVGILASCCFGVAALAAIVSLFSGHRALEHISIMLYMRKLRLFTFPAVDCYESWQYGGLIACVLALGIGGARVFSLGESKSGGND